MKARQAVMQYYGGHCCWCGSAEDLELDHVDGGQGQGNAHRRAIRGKLEYWLRREGFPPGYQVLCRRCHDLKSGRMAHMPPRQGKVDLRVEIDATLAQQVEVLAATGKTKREIVETALLAHLQGSAHESMLTTLHTRMDAMTAQIDRLKASIAELTAALTQVANRQERLEQQYQHQIFATLASLYDQVKAQEPGKKRKLLPW
jgi:flagellar capping protein FliD